MAWRFHRRCPDFGVAQPPRAGRPLDPLRSREVAVLDGRVHAHVAERKPRLGGKVRDEARKLVPGQRRQLSRVGRDLARFGNQLLPGAAEILEDAGRHAHRVVPGKRAWSVENRVAHGRAHLVTVSSRVDVAASRRTRPLWRAGAPLIGGFVVLGLAGREAAAEHLQNSTIARGHRSCPPAARTLAASGGSAAMEAPADDFDLLLGTDALRRVEVLPHARVVAQQRGRAVAELLGDVLRRLALVDQQRREARAQVARSHAPSSSSARRPAALATARNVRLRQLSQS